MSFSLKTFAKEQKLKEMCLTAYTLTKLHKDHLFCICGHILVHLIGLQ